MGAVREDWGEGRLDRMTASKPRLKAAWKFEDCPLGKGPRAEA